MSRYAIIDIETTGGRIKRDRITEVGIVISDGHNIVDTFQSLCNPGFSIPSYISRLTGITDDMVASAPRFFEIAKQIVTLTEGCIFVAHNVRFDYSFIKESFKRLGYNYNRKQLCTVRMAKECLPELKKHDLGSLSKYYSLTIKNRHRAFDDAYATTLIFHQLIQKNEGTEIALDLINRGIKGAKLPSSISLEDLHALPETTGVYYFHDRFDNIIYVGKSINIQSRVMQHFAEFTQKSASLYQQVCKVSYTETGSELVALLHENHEIKRLNPQINKALRKKDFPYAIFGRKNKDGYLEIAAGRVKKSETDNVIKYYPKLKYARHHIQGLVEEFELCAHLCHWKTGTDHCFNWQIGKCKGACQGIESAGTYNVRALEAIEFLKRTVKDDFVLIDEGRSPYEKSFVKVENGELKGIGYLTEGCVIEQYEAFDEHMDPYPNTRDAQRLIHWYVKENKMEKLISKKNRP